MVIFEPDYTWLIEIIFIILLILANGCFAMTEIAIIGSKPARLETMAKKGSKGAQIAIEIARDPSDFLSAIQIGITLIGILTGAFSGATMATYLTPILKELSVPDKWAPTAAFTIVVSLVTYLSLIVGELVPKKIAINNPENIASFVARPIQLFVYIFKPFVKLLSASSAFMFNLLGLKENDKDQITEEELLLALDDGAKSGVVEESEIDMMKNIIESGDMRVGSLMVPRGMVVWLDSKNSVEKNLKVIESTSFDCYPLANGDLDEIEGFIYSSDLANFLSNTEPVDFFKIRKKPFFIPENMSVLRALLTLGKDNIRNALIIDEFGGIAGMVDSNDLMRALIGDLENLSRSTGAPQIIQRGENSWLIDGMLHISEFKDLLELEELPGEDKYRYNTLAGFIIALLGHIPVIGEKIDWDDYHMEIVDMDNKRIDMVMVSKQPSPDRQDG